MIRTLDERDPNNNGQYCFSVKRNPVVNGTQYHRSPFNTDKTILKRPLLFNRLGSDTTISFLYTNDASKEKTDNEILLEFSKKDN